MKLKKLAVKTFLGFIALMVVCTILSRAAASVLVAQAEVKRPGRGKLSYVYEGEGSIVPKNEEKLFLWEGQQVEWTAKQGSTIEKGKCLVQFRKEYLDKEIEKKQSELKQLKLQEKEQQISARKPARVPAAEGARQTLKDAEKKLEKTRRKEKKAKELWEAFKEKTAIGDEATSMKEQELKEEYLAAKSEAEAAGQEKSQAQTAYNLAKKEDAAQDKNNANAQEAANVNAQTIGEQVSTAEKELETLKKYKKAKGKMLAEKKSTVLGNNIQAGAITAGTEYLAVGTGGWKLKGELTKEDRNKIAEGADIIVQFDTGEELETKIESVEETEGKQEEETQIQSEYFWYAPLPDESETDEAETFTWKAETDSAKEYEQIIPISALREDVDGAYCLIVTEKEQMLGTVKTAKRIPVKVLEKDGKNVAVASELKKTDEIIISSEKFVSGGDRIRIKE